jgi:hypothetical protein
MRDAGCAGAVFMARPTCHDGDPMEWDICGFSDISETMTLRRAGVSDIAECGAHW